jgi:hypothetical protein
MDIDNDGKLAILRCRRRLPYIQSYAIYHIDRWDQLTSSIPLRFRLTLYSNTDHRRLLYTNRSEIPCINQFPLRGRLPLLIEPLWSPPTEIFDRWLDVWYSAEEVDPGAGGVTEECLGASISIE